MEKGKKKENYSELIIIIYLICSTSILPVRPALFHHSASAKYCWIANQHIQKIIDPFGMETVDLTLAVTAPGTYDLGAHLEIWCCNENQPETPILQLCRNTSAFVVINESKQLKFCNTM